MGVSINTSGGLTADGPSQVFSPRGKFNISLAFGTATGTMTLVRSFDKGATWVPVVKPDFTAAAFTGSTSFSGEEPEDGVWYRFDLTGYGGAGTLSYRFSQ